jgi:hypothetical protein
MTHKLDLSAFHNFYKNQKVGRKAYPLALLLRIIFYAYYKDISPAEELPKPVKRI